MITIREPGSIYQVDVPIENGSCHRRWHFSFGRNVDPKWVEFRTASDTELLLADVLLA